MARRRARNHTAEATERALKLVPASGSVDDLVDNVAGATRRAVRLLSFELAPGEPTGFWIATAAADYVVYPSSVTKAQRTVIICHELSHLLLGHEPVGEAARLAQLAATVAPDISPEVARRMLARHGYAEEVEVEAETLATRLVTQLAIAAERNRLTKDTISTRLR